MRTVCRGQIPWLFFLCSYKRMSLHHSLSVIHNHVSGKRWIYLCTEKKDFKVYHQACSGAEFHSKSGDPQTGLLEKVVSPFVFVAGCL